MMSWDDIQSGLHELQTDQLITISAVLTIIQGMEKRTLKRWDIEEAVAEVQDIIQTRQSAERSVQ